MKINDWFVGIVEDINDPSGLGRVRARCLGYHTPDRNELPTIDLPLATVMLPTTSASMSGIGVSATSLLPNTWVFGFFRDGQELQDPVIMGTIASASGYDTGYDVTTNMGFGDPHGAFKSFIGPDIPTEAGTASSLNGSSVLNSGRGANNVNNVYTNSSGLQTSFDSPPDSAPSISGDVGSRIIEAARSQIGVKETSKNQGPGIEKYWTAVSYSGGYRDRAPWCAAFVCWCIKQSGILSEQERPKTAVAYDLEAWGRSKSYVQTRGNPRFVRRGDIVTMRSWSHVVIAVSDSDANGRFQCIDGNSESGVVNIRNRSVASARCACTITSNASTNTVI